MTRKKLDLALRKHKGKETLEDFKLKISKCNLPNNDECFVGLEKSDSLSSKIRESNLNKNQIDNYFTVRYDGVPFTNTLFYNLKGKYYLAKGYLWVDDSYYFGFYTYQFNCIFDEMQNLVLNHDIESCTLYDEDLTIAIKIDLYDDFDYQSGEKSLSMIFRYSR
jgi:hypothetical protein